jgi:hypothetical protein
MSYNDNMLSNHDVNSNTDIQNKGFLILDKMFRDNGWSMIKNEMDWICYTKFGYETDLFDIKIKQKSIQVSIPIQNSPYQFVTSFNDYFQASEYIEERFMDFITYKKN